MEGLSGHPQSLQGSIVVTREVLYDLIVCSLSGITLLGLAGQSCGV